jgi:hypothetical protein
MVIDNNIIKKKYLLLFIVILFILGTLVVFHLKTLPTTSNFTNLQDSDGDVYNTIEVVENNNFVIKNMSESDVSWIITSSEKNDGNIETSSYTLSDTLSNVIESGTIKSDLSTTIELKKGVYELYAYCNDGSSISIEYKLNKSNKY